MNLSSDGFAALVLAAGYSSRVGSIKPLLPLGDSVIIG
jgi:CTP:molybdopterin cytidylyltransferase MocA